MDDLESQRRVLVKPLLAANPSMRIITRQNLDIARSIKAVVAAQ
jgi:hypothetical protein